MLSSSLSEYVDVFSNFGQFLNGTDLRILADLSRGEKVRILGPVEHRNRLLYFLDLSTGSPTGTFKDWLACLCVAQCLQSGVKELVTQTSGNTGNALAFYGGLGGVKVHAIFPRANRYKIQPQVVESCDGCRFLEFDGDEPEQKILVKDLAERLGLSWFPTLDQQIEANKLRAYFLSDWCSRSGVKFDWHCQALSSAFGVFGFYHGLDELGVKSRPRFLGVQQEFRAPYAGVAPDLSKPMSEPTLFRSEPSPELLDRMQDILASTGGRIEVLSWGGSREDVARAAELYSEVGLEIKRSVVIDDYHEKSPLMTLAKVLEGVREGWIKEGQSVLIAVTGGAGKIPVRAFEGAKKIGLPRIRRV